MRGRFSIFAALLLVSTTAAAMPQALVFAGAWLLSYGTLLSAAGWVVGIGLVVGGSVWGASQQRKAMQEQEAAARAAYNASLKDRTTTVISSEHPYVYVYGKEVVVGVRIVDVLTSGDRDQYHHLVCVAADHECEAILDIAINDKWLGALDANGNVTAGDYLYTEPQDATEYKSGTTFTLAHTPLAGSLRITWWQGSIDNGRERGMPYTLVGNEVTVSVWHNFTCSYRWAKTTPRVRVAKRLGAPATPADPATIAECPTQYTATSTMDEKCGLIVRLDLDHAEFQGGVPSVKLKLNGKKVHDVRDPAWPADVPVCSSNPALCLADYLTSEMCRVPLTDLPQADYIAAANACDTVESFGARYTLNGTVRSDQDRGQVLDAMTLSMAGTLCSTTWGTRAGVWEAPVLALTQDDIVGDFSFNAGASDADLFNGVKGQFVSADNLWVATDYKPYQNAAYMAADGAELWTNIDFPFTDSLQRVHNLCRILAEDQRNAFTVEGYFSHKAWDVPEHGQRVTFTSPFLGQTAKIYRVMDKKVGLKQAVWLKLKEDAATIYDMADAVVADSTPNTSLPDPFAIAPLESLTCTSGTDVMQRNGDGTITSRILVQWPPATTPGVVHGGYIEVEWSRLGEDVWNGTPASGGATEVYIGPVEDSAFYKLRARAVNATLNIKSAWLYATHEVEAQQTIISELTDDVAAATEAVAAAQAAAAQAAAAQAAAAQAAAEQAAAALREASGQADVSLDALGNARITFTTYNDPQILGYELREGETFDAGVLVATTSGNSFTLPVLGSAGKIYWIRAKYAAGYSTAGYRIDFSGSNMPAPGLPTWSIAEPNLVYAWAASAGAAQYLCLFEVGGVTTVKTVTTPGVSFPIPKYDATIRIVAMAADGTLSPFVDEEISLGGQYHYNEIVNVALPLTTGQYLNLAFTAANTVKRASLLGNAPVAPYAQNINDGDLYTFGYNLANLAASSIQGISASWFRNGFWRERAGYFESAVVDLGAVLTGSLILNLTKTVTYVGNAPVSSYAHVSAEYMADANTQALTDQKAFLTARFFVATDSAYSANWKEAANGDWITARYVKIVVEVAMASPLTEITVTAGAITIDVPDVTETGSTAGVTSAGKAIAFAKSYHSVSVVIATARGAAKAYTGNITATGCTLYADTGSQQVDYFVKGF